MRGARAQRSAARDRTADEATRDKLILFDVLATGVMRAWYVAFFIGIGVALPVLCLAYA